MDATMSTELRIAIIIALRSSAYCRLTFGIEFKATKLIAPAVLYFLFKTYPKICIGT